MYVLPKYLLVAHDSRISWTWSSLTLMFALFVLSACQPIQSTAPVAAAKTPDMGSVVIDINEEGLTAPSAVSAGLVPVVFTNSGQAPHVLEMYWMAEGVTVEDALNAGPLGSPDKSGGMTVSFLAPGASLETVIDFGVHPNYFVEEVFVENPGRVQFTASGESTTAEAPDADVKVGLVDFNIVMPDEIKAGPQWWQVKNTGSQSHELALFKLDGDLTAEKVMERLAAVDAEAQVPPTVEEITSWAPGVGLTTWVKYDLSPGKYLVLCRVPNWSTMPPGQDHWHMGMLHEFAVVP